MDRIEATLDCQLSHTRVIETPHLHTSMDICIIHHTNTLVHSVIQFLVVALDNPMHLSFNYSNLLDLLLLVAVLVQGVIIEQVVVLEQVDVLEQVVIIKQVVVVEQVIVPEQLVIAIIAIVLK